MTTPVPVHWLRGGSVSDRIVPCPGCVHEAAKWPKDPSGPPAIDGTHSHTLLERCVKENKHPQMFVGATLRDHEGSFQVDMARAERVAQAWGYLQARLSEKPGASVFSEVFVDAGAAHGVPSWGGSCDLLIVWDDEIEVFDYKDGGKPVSVKTWQLVSYGVGAVNKVGPRPKVRLTICQPKAHRAPVHRDLTHDEFEVLTAELTRYMRASVPEDAPRVAGDHCKWCPGAKPGRCDSFNARLSGGIQTMSELPSAPSGGVLQIPSVSESQLSDEQIAQVLDAAPLVREWLKEVEGEALKRHRDGRAIPGYKLTRKSTHRRFADNAMEIFEALRLPKAAYLESKLTSIPKLLESDAVKKLSAKRRARFDEAITKPEGALILVPQSAPGKVVEVGLTHEAIEKAGQTALPATKPSTLEPAAPAATYNFI